MHAILVTMGTDGDVFPCVRRPAPTLSANIWTLSAKNWTLSAKNWTLCAKS